MDLLSSPRLLHMMAACSKKPAERLLALYPLLDSWLNAPGSRDMIRMQYSSPDALARACSALGAHLLPFALEAKLQHPPAVIAKLMVLLQGAIAEELRNPGQGALSSAQLAARMVLEEAKPSWMTSVEESWMAGGYVAIAVVLAILGIHFWPAGVPPEVEPAWQSAGYHEADVAIEPALLIKVLALKSDIASGTCPAPGFASVPGDQLAVYMHIVQSGLSNNQARQGLDGQKLESFLAWYAQHRAWECYSKSQSKQKTILGMGA